MQDTGGGRYFGVALSRRLLWGSFLDHRWRRRAQCSHGLVETLQGGKPVWRRRRDAAGLRTARGSAPTHSQRDRGAAVPPSVAARGLHPRPDGRGGGAGKNSGGGGHVGGGVRGVGGFGAALVLEEEVLVLSGRGRGAVPSGCLLREERKGGEAGPCFMVGAAFGSSWPGGEAGFERAPRPTGPDATA